MTTQKLTLSHIKEDNKKYNEKQRIELNDQYHTYIYPNFDPTRVNKMIKTLIKDYVEIQSKKGVKTDLGAGDLAYLYTVIEFSDIADMPKTLTAKIKMLEEVAKSDHIRTIHEAFPKESLKKVEDAANGFVDFISRTANENADKINEDILKKVEELTKEDS
ncbi:hypothetical protein L3137_15535 [Bacillus sonorensis]|uniref:hypothetical protein n=1 Tax=Bacillus sonorensis TaxID=119858 RepID=UPI001F1FA4B3|nr:hypothetical protein [Bacillus sonorensis]MCF7618669.1 hypothetical protein [Bacillus sonorensis]